MSYRPASSASSCATLQIQLCWTATKKSLQVTITHPHKQTHKWRSWNKHQAGCNEGDKNENGFSFWAERCVDSGFYITCFWWVLHCSDSWTGNSFLNETLSFFHAWLHVDFVSNYKEVVAYICWWSEGKISSLGHVLYKGESKTGENGLLKCKLNRWLNIST